MRAAVEFSCGETPVACTRLATVASTCSLLNTRTDREKSSNRYAETIYRGIEQSIPVSLRMHPRIVDLSWLFPIRNILFKQTEVRSGLSGTFAQVRLACILV